MEILKLSISSKAEKGFWILLEKYVPTFFRRWAFLHFSHAAVTSDSSSFSLDREQPSAGLWMSHLLQQVCKKSVFSANLKKKSRSRHYILKVNSALSFKSCGRQSGKQCSIRLMTWAENETHADLSRLERKQFWKVTRFSASVNSRVRDVQLSCSFGVTFICSWP